MENASKALLMAAAILIAMAIIAMSMVIFNDSKRLADSTNIDDQTIAIINNKIKPYIGENISGTQVNALIDTVYSLNASDETVKIKITLDNKNFLVDKIFEGSSRRVETKSNTYKVEVKNDSSGYINEINITTN